MPQPQIKITIAPDGKLKTEVLNAQGESCMAMTAPLESLGTTQTQLKPEYFMVETVDLTSNINVGGM